eukprot:Opistho-2@74963
MAAAPGAAVSMGLDASLAALQKSGDDLANLALYCARTYNSASTPAARDSALNATKKYACDALASVAYQLHSAATATNKGVERAGRALHTAGEEIYVTGQIIDLVIETGGLITPATVPSSTPVYLFEQRPPKVARLGRDPPQNNPLRTPMQFDLLNRVGTGADALDGVARSRIVARVVGGAASTTPKMPSMSLDVFGGGSTPTSPSLSRHANNAPLHSPLGLSLPRPAGTDPLAQSLAPRGVGRSHVATTFMAAPPPSIAPIAPVAPPKAPEVSKAAASAEPVILLEDAAVASTASESYSIVHAMYDYADDAPDSLALTTGMHVTLLSVAGDWMYGESPDGLRRGWFPASYVSTE